jgi:hypothetical protein
MHHKNINGHDLSADSNVQYIFSRIFLYISFHKRNKYYVLENIKKFNIFAQFLFLNAFIKKPTRCS